MKKPKVSVIIPTYNRKEKLKKTIRELEKQSYGKNRFEIIVVDDCSEDGTEEEIKNLMKKYKNLRYLRNEKNSGAAHSRNRGIRIAKGKYIFFTDDDCIPDEDWIKKFVEFFEEHEEVAGIGGPVIPVSNNLIAKIETLKNKILKIKAKKMKIGKDVPIGFTGNLAYRKKIFKKIGFFNEKFRTGEDIELKKRVAKKFVLAYLPVQIWHNQEYDLNYLMDLLFKQGLDTNPPPRKHKIISLLFSSPYLIYNITRKIIRYRKGRG